jgi:hypothetical protein
MLTNIRDLGTHSHPKITHVREIQQMGMAELTSLANGKINILGIMTVISTYNSIYA